MKKKNRQIFGSDKGGYPNNINYLSGSLYHQGIEDKIDNSSYQVFPQTHHGSNRGAPDSCSKCDSLPGSYYIIGYFTRDSNIEPGNKIGGGSNFLMLTKSNFRFKFVLPFLIF